MSPCRGWTLDNSPAQLPPSLGKGHAKGGGTFQTHQGEWQGKVTKPGHRPNTVHHDNDDHKILSGEAVQLGGGGESGDVLFLVVPATRPRAQWRASETAPGVHKRHQLVNGPHSQTKGSAACTRCLHAPTNGTPAGVRVAYRPNEDSRRPQCEACGAASD